LTIFFSKCSHHLFYLKKKLKKKPKKKREKRNMLRWPNHPIIFPFFFLTKIKYVMGIFWEKEEVKVVELSQFESLEGGLSVTFEILEVKMKIGR
jgi:hypothetical protein